MGGVIIPKTYITPIENPLIFLAGPCGGAPLWQDEAIQIILSRESDVTIASPRWDVRPGIAQYILSGDDAHFPRARAWERHYLDIASKTGAILFWLPGEIEHSCEKSYGAMTRLEIGQWMTQYRFDKSVRICIGTDGKFSELHTIKHDLSLDCPDLQLKGNLEETCLEALRLASQK